MTEYFVTDGGLETDLIFNHHVELPDFAAFPLVEDEAGRDLLRAYYRDYARIAVHAQVPLLLETPTWRASSDWGKRLGYDAAGLDRVNQSSVELLHLLARECADELVAWQVGGSVGPRGDGYRPGTGMDPDAAADYHRAQVASFAAAGADRVTALTLTGVGEAVGIARAGADAGIAIAIGFTVETDGRLPDGTSLADAVSAVDSQCPPAYFVVNCAHPTHVENGLTAGGWRDRVQGLRVNASIKSHAELDEAEELDDGDPSRLAEDVAALRSFLPEVGIVGGCCGTDARHVGAMWGVNF